jgi:membrane-associated protein
MEIINLLLDLDTHIAVFIGMHGDLIYLLLFTIVCLEIGFFPLFFLPGNPLIFVAGSFCNIGSLNLTSTIAALLCGAILGNIISYRIGHLFGDKINQRVRRGKPSIWLNEKALNKTKAFFDKYGQFTLMISPFIAMVRTFAPLLAGISQMQHRKYLLFSTIGALQWVILLVFSGYYFSNITFIKMHMASIVLSGLAIGLMLVVIGFFRTKINQKRS